MMVITLLGENMSGQSPSQAEVEEWADMYDLNHPVLGDDGFAVTYSYVEGNSVGLPSFSLIGPGMEIIRANDWVTESDAVNNLP